MQCYTIKCNAKTIRCKNSAINAVWKINKVSQIYYLNLSALLKINSASKISYTGKWAKNEPKSAKNELKSAKNEMKSAKNEIKSAKNEQK